MLLATVVLSAALAPQALPDASPQAPPAEPPAATAPAASPQPAAPGGDAFTHLSAGIAAFKKRRFAAARTEFEKAEAADPQSAAAAYYLGYTFYKLGEPARRMNANKERARELFAKAFGLDPTFAPTWGR
jgi:tetratricopeptide (TPR) repeat protein